MQLLIIRHAAAVARGTEGVPDEARPLTPKGEKRFKQAARGLARLVRRPDALLTSPLVRARRTAELAAKAWGRVKPIELEALAAGDDEGLGRALAGQPADATIAIVGHEPYLSSLLSRVLGAGRGERLAFDKGGAALVELTGSLADGGRLIFFLPQDALRLLGD